MSSIDSLVDAFVTYLAVEKGLSANTLASYKRDLEKYRTYLREIGRTELAQVTEQDVSEFLAYLARGDKSAGRPALAPTSVTRSLSAVRSLHKFAVGEGALEVDVAKRVAPPKQPSRYPKALSISEVTRLIESIPDGDTAEVTDLRNRGVKDVFFVVRDGLKGLPEAVSNVWPQATVQTCIIHLIRNVRREASVLPIGGGRPSTLGRRSGRVKLGAA